MRHLGASWAICVKMLCFPARRRHPTKLISEFSVLRAPQPNLVGGVLGGNANHNNTIGNEIVTKFQLIPPE